MTEALLLQQIETEEPIINAFRNIVETYENCGGTLKEIMDVCLECAEDEKEKEIYMKIIGHCLAAKSKEKPSHK